MKKTLLLTGAALFILSSTSCLIKARVCNCTYTDQTGSTGTTSEEYLGGMFGTSKKQQKQACSDKEKSLQSSYASASCSLN
ncbi:MAG TPA: hypothetical protein VIL57_05285 [Bacteroidia bacterium]